MKIVKLLSSSNICRSIIHKLIGGRFIAGEILDEAIETVKKLNKKGFIAIINFLGENNGSNNLQKSFKMYCRIINAIVDNKLNARISIKPSQVGINIKPKIQLSYLMILAEMANYHKIPIEMDMEEEEDIDATLEASMMLKKSFPNLKIRQAIQVKLHRTAWDIFTLLRAGIIIRLCEGAYFSKNIKQKSVIKIIFERYSYDFPTTYFEFATHDMKKLKRLNGKSPVAFLLGFNRRLADKYVKSGRQVAIYVPFGTEWMPYGIRRIGYILTHMPSILKDDLFYFFNKK